MAYEINFTIICSDNSDGQVVADLVHDIERDAMKRLIKTDGVVNPAITARQDGRLPVPTQVSERKKEK